MLLLVKGFTPEIDATGIVKDILSGDTITLLSGATIELADVSAPQDGAQGFNNSKNFLKHYLTNENGTINLIDTEVFLDLSSNESQSPNTYTAVVYIIYSDGYYLNVNNYLLENNNLSSIKIDNTANDFNPFFWGEPIVSKLTLADNSLLNSNAFNQDRLELLKSYTSQTLTHSTLLVTITIAIPTVIFTFYSNKEKIGKLGKPQKIMVYVIISTLFLALFYDICRLFYWSWMSSSVLGVLPSQAIITGTDTVALGIQTYLKNAFVSYHFIGFIYDFNQAIVLLLPISMFLGILTFKLITERNQGSSPFINKKAIIVSVVFCNIVISLIALMVAGTLRFWYSMSFVFVTAVILVVLNELVKDSINKRNNSVTQEIVESDVL